MGKILIVDDDAGVADSVALVLREAGHEPRIASDGRSALAAMTMAPPDACVLDVWLGEEDGLAVAEAARGRGLPVVVMSGGGPGRSLEQVTARADALGAVRVLYKPFDDDELTEAVDAALGR